MFLVTQVVYTVLSTTQNDRVATCLPWLVAEVMVDRIHASFEELLDNRLANDRDSGRSGRILQIDAPPEDQVRCLEP